MKHNKIINSILLITTISMAAVGCGSQPSSISEPTEVQTQPVPAADKTQEETNTTLYGTVNLTYADFYYGELNDIEPDLTATEGDYQAASKVKAAGYDKEGMYDAVTSATKQKSTRFAATYFEEVGDGVNILGIANANVAISKALYKNVQDAISAGTACNNELIDIVKAMTITDSAPVDYKVINPDGTLSKTVGETTVASDVKSTFTSISSWGNYQINFEGIELEADQVIGGIIETSDGAKYGLEHEDNLWLHPDELSFCVVPFTEPHGNEVAYNRFADMQGKTITKFTYLVSNGVDIEIPLNAFVYHQPGSEFAANADNSVTFSTDGTVVNYSLTTPSDSDYKLTAVKFGRNVLDISQVQVGESTITLPASFGPGKYTFVFEDTKYAGLSVATLVESGLSDGDVVLKDDTVVITKDCGLTSAQFIANFASMTVNGEPVNGRGLGNIVFDENGKLNKEAAIENENNSTPIFTDGENKVEITSTGFPTLTFTFNK